MNVLKVTAATIQRLVVSGTRIMSISAVNAQHIRCEHELASYSVLSV